MEKIYNSNLRRNWILQRSEITAWTHMSVPQRAEEKRENEVNYETYLKEEEVPHIWQQLVSKFQSVGVVCV